MKVDRDILAKLWHDSATLQIAKEYQNNGYKVKVGERIAEKYEADIIAQKEDEIIIIEVKSGKWSETDARRIQQLRNFVVHHYNAKFKLVFVNPYKDKTIEIENIDRILSDEIERVYEYQIGEIATHTYFDEISDVEIENVTVRSDGIEASGNGIVSFNLQYGSDGDVSRDEGFQTGVSFPFQFHIILDFNLKEAVDVISLEIDSSSYFD